MKNKKDYNFYIYIMASTSGTIYIGVTNSLRRRIYEHRNDLIDGFTKEYSCHKLVYYEHYKYINKALFREKELKKWNRDKKQNLIDAFNPHWHDLYTEIAK